LILLPAERFQNSNKEMDAKGEHIMAKQGLLIALSLAIAALPALAQTPAYNFDVDTVTDGVQTSTTVNVNDQFLVQVVMTDADRLLGYSFDVDFDPSILELVAVYENPGDLNFNGDTEFAEVGAAIDFFIDNQLRPEKWPLTADDINDDQQFTFPRDEVTGDGPRNGVVLDDNGNNNLDFAEVGRLIDEFILDQLPDTDENRAKGKVAYWTDLAAARPEFDFNESVEIFDPPQLSNAGSVEGTPGRINDITGVLLARPDAVDPGTGTRPGYGLSGDLVLVTLKFEAIAAGSSTLAFPGADPEDEYPVYIDEDFTGLDDVISSTSNGTATVTVN
jgi:hypothetical protein